MLILAINTASSACSVALWRDGTVLATKDEAMPRGQDARLLPLIREILPAAKTGFAALDRIAVLRGPGSFTGLRIGLAAARGLGLALGTPVFGGDRFRLYPASLRPQRDLLAVIDSRRDALFCRHFTPAGAESIPFLAAAAQLAEYDRPGMAVCGDGAAAMIWQQAAFMPLPQPESCLAAGMAALADPGDPAWQPLPLYLRPPDVSCGPVPQAEEPAA